MAGIAFDTRRTGETNNSSLMSREKQNRPRLLLVHRDSADISRVSLLSFLLAFHLRLPLSFLPFLSLSPFRSLRFFFFPIFIPVFTWFLTKQYDLRDREQRNQLNRIIRPFVSVSFSSVASVHVYLVILLPSLSSVPFHPGFLVIIEQLATKSR